MRAAARGDRSIGDVRNRLSKLRPENQGQAKDKRRDQGYLRVDENLLRNNDTADKIARTKKPVQERRFNDKLARESSEFIWNSDWRKELDTWEKSLSHISETVEFSMMMPMISKGRTLLSFMIDNIASN